MGPGEEEASIFGRFLKNILTGMAAGAARRGCGGRGWGASALVMGQLHRAPPTATCAQVSEGFKSIARN